ncbi:annexin D3, partial [Olea europaea subsp. europaea]
MIKKQWIPALPIRRLLYYTVSLEQKILEDDDLVWILSTRNIFQLRATFQCYKGNYGKFLDEDIRACGKGILESIFKVVVWCIDSLERHFVECIKGD